MYITKIKMNKIIQEIAKQENVSEELIYLEMEKAINSINWNNFKLKRKPSLLEATNFMTTEIMK